MGTGSIGGKGGSHAGSKPTEGKGAEIKVNF